MKTLRQSIESLLNSLSHKQQVSFALYCAKDSFQYLDPKHRKEAQLCIDLVQRWLNGEVVSNEELVAAFSASYAAHVTSAAASFAASSASYAASYTTSSASYASYAASYAAHAAFSASSASNEEYNIKMKHYYAYLCTEIAKFDKLEMLLLDINY